MGHLEYTEEVQRFRLRQIHNGSISSVIRNGSPCHQDDDSHGSKRMMYSGPELPEDIWCHIHSLLLLRDAARAACVSRAFFRSWRSLPHLMFDMPNIASPGLGSSLTSRVDHILKNHSGNGLKTLRFDMFPRIGEYNFPCPLLSVRLGRLRSLTTLNLCDVRITGDELECLLSSCVALQCLELRKCSEITWLKLPFLLQHLSCLKVNQCRHLRRIKIQAPSISSFQVRGGKLKLFLGESLQIKNLDIVCSHGVIYYARKALPSSAPNLESLAIYSTHEKLTTTTMPSKFPHLKYLKISLRYTYDYFSLVSFLDAAPSLETFILDVAVSLPTKEVERESIFVDTSSFRRMPGYCLGKLKRVKIFRFYSAKGLVELACHILGKGTILQRAWLSWHASSPECLTLDTSAGQCGLTMRYPTSNLTEIPKAISGIRTYIEGIVPSRVELNVVKPCSRCYTG